MGCLHPLHFGRWLSLSDREPRTDSAAATTDLLPINAEHFGKILAELITSPERLSMIGRTKRQTIELRHTWDEHVDRLEELFGEIVESRRVTDKKCRNLA